MFNIKYCQWLDSNRGLLELEATALPTEPRHCPIWTSKREHILLQSILIWPFLSGVLSLHRSESNLTTCFKKLPKRWPVAKSGHTGATPSITFVKYLLCFWRVILDVQDSIYCSTESEVGPEPVGELEHQLLTRRQQVKTSRTVLLTFLWTTIFGKTFC